MGRLGVCLVLMVAGCSLDARVDIAAAGAMDGLADSMEGVVREYHGEVERADDSMELAVVDAFVARVRRDVADEAVVDAHSEDFRAAMGRLRADRGVEATRFRTALDNVDVVREVARGLRRLGAASMTLEDDARRYLFSMLEDTGPQIQTVSN